MPVTGGTLDVLIMAIILIVFLNKDNLKCITEFLYF